jgi:copper(I)-binding protein
MTTRLLPWLLLSLLTLGCREGGSLHAENARVVLPPPGGKVAAAYLTLLNPEPQGYELTSAESAAFDSIEIHETFEQDGMARMRQLDRVPVPARGQLELAPSGKHLMLFGPKQAPVGDAALPITLVLRRADGRETRLAVSFGVSAAGQESEH